jgi:hypothetical protein
MKVGKIDMVIISVYDYNDASGERFMYEEKDINEAVKRYKEYVDSFDKHDRPYIVLLYTESGNIINGF